MLWKQWCLGLLGYASRHCNASWGAGLAVLVRHAWTWTIVLWLKNKLWLAFIIGACGDGWTRSLRVLGLA